MSDELKNKSGKVKVMYVRSDDDSDKRTHNPRTGKGGGRPGKSRVDGRSRPARDERNSRGDDRKRDDRKRDDRKRDDFIATMRLRGVPFPALLAMRRR
ncbi:tRNA/rRNA methyltransferase yfiF [Klebsiella pneumoniae]|uniref:tRNA/rRNA methyltransferase yfiF n=1 Tax=Klebsiella pneumoniae TaxID=573 RepID=A0A4P0YCX3_KLEPN|nr:tRNA/rRNA methyltransferase yfiF [Klebsiella pneumoniae]